MQKVAAKPNNSIFTMALLLIALLCFSAANGSEIKTGSHSFEFTDWQGPKLTVWSHVPKSYTNDYPIVFIMHGVNRDADRYRNEWRRFAETHQFMVIAPEFSKSHFPRSKSYNLGNIQDKENNINPKSLWSFSAIEPLFDYVKTKYQNSAKKYGIYGHSAGAQFVHRFNYFVPDARINIAISANAGWYTLPTSDFEYPYGLQDMPINRGHIEKAFATNLIILLGTSDTNTKSKTLRKTKEAMQQGPHRLARGNYYYKLTQKIAEQNKMTFNWQRKYAPDVGHSNRKMAAYAAQFFARTKIRKATRQRSGGGSGQTPDF